VREHPARCAGPTDSALDLEPSDRGYAKPVEQGESAADLTGREKLTMRHDPELSLVEVNSGNRVHVWVFALQTCRIPSAYEPLDGLRRPEFVGPHSIGSDTLERPRRCRKLLGSPTLQARWSKLKSCLVACGLSGASRQRLQRHRDKSSTVPRGPRRSEPCSRSSSLGLRELIHRLVTRPYDKSLITPAVLAQGGADRLVRSELCTVSTAESPLSLATLGFHRA
jgi:hypothetical protein